MEKFEIPVQLRWADLDPNFHFRHSVYYDWATTCRLDFLKERGLTSTLTQSLQIGPVIFREECVFRKEINFDDQVSIDLRLMKSRRDFSRWTIMHDICKNGSTVCAQVMIDGAWMNTVERKLFIPPAAITQVFQQIPFDENFQWMD